MISLTHILLLGLVLVIFFGPSKLPALGRAFGKSKREFDKALHGEEDIDVTDTVKRIDD
jgi:sec-independent protein translocase protein TatA